MKRKVVTRTLCGIFFGIFLVLIYGVSNFVYRNLTLAKASGLVCEFGDMRARFSNYYETNHHWPRNLDVVRTLVLNDSCMLDPISEKPLVYYPDAKPWTNEILMAQPEPFRTELWPFGKMQRYVMLGNGDIRTLMDQGAINDPQEYDFSKNDLQ